MIHDVSELYESKNPIVRYYFQSVVKAIIELIDCSKDDLILDFGCGQQYMKKKMPGFNIVGYDIVPKFSDVKDYRKLKPKIIVCSHVFEHLDEKGMVKILEDFKKMKPDYIISAQPTENIISQIGRIFHPVEGLDEHILSWKQVHSIMSRDHRKIMGKNILTMTQIAKWEPKA